MYPGHVRGYFNINYLAEKMSRYIQVVTLPLSESSSRSAPCCSERRLAPVRIVLATWRDDDDLFLLARSLCMLMDRNVAVMLLMLPGDISVRDSLREREKVDQEPRASLLS